MMMSEVFYLKILFLNINIEELRKETEVKKYFVTIQSENDLEHEISIRTLNVLQLLSLFAWTTKPNGYCCDTSHKHEVFSPCCD